MARPLEAVSEHPWLLFGGNQGQTFHVVVCKFGVDGADEVEELEYKGKYIDKQASFGEMRRNDIP